MQGHHVAYAFDLPPCALASIVSRPIECSPRVVGFRLPRRERRMVRTAKRHAGSHGLYRLEIGLAVSLVVAGIDKRHRPLHQLHDRDVTGRTDLEGTELG